ncbi:hypothetical protein OSB04_031876 [Centaurea solstitialis]|uniref:DUF4216 domain-containing protein n=1 Tax=Centaurea solstitialis TaxID=347529 RepID=A0AA38SB90_9ASTR|nr:hypothetical protein OSB04_031876 [Centaurea solstitialis]
MDHQRSLSKSHPYRKLKKEFDGKLSMECLLELLLNISGKMKDGVKVRKDMVEMGIRPQLAPAEKGSRTYLPPACYTLSRVEKTRFCQYLHGVKVSSGYSSNTKKLVSMKDLKLLGRGMVGFWSAICCLHIKAMTLMGIHFTPNGKMKKSTMQNSGVTLIATTTEYDKANNDARSRIVNNSYYGVIQEIWELEYNSLSIPLFKCKWVDNQQGVKVDNDEFIVIDLSKESYGSEPFILAKQASQVFFVEDPKDSKWHIVLHGKRHIVGLEKVVDEEEYDQFNELPPFSVGIPSSNVDINDTTYLRSDHNERLWVDKNRDT